MSSITRNERLFATTRARLGLRWLEWSVLFIALPLIIGWWIPPETWPYLLAAVAVAGLAAGRRTLRLDITRSLDARERALLPGILRRFLVCAIALLGTVAILAPERLFRMPLEQPGTWALLLLGYPLFSVYPQELIYRRIFHQRYGELFPNRFGWTAASAVAFAWLHIVYGNLVAPLLTLLGGWFLARTYHRVRSLRLVVIEHTLYGTLVFSIGTGEFFHHSSVAP